MISDNFFEIINVEFVNSFEDRSKEAVSLKSEIIPVQRQSFFFKSMKNRPVGIEIICE
jgi:outer membrane receptor for Fe3+-dicitrate